MQAKICSKCRQARPITEFGKDKKRKDGLNPRCKSCIAEYYKNNKHLWQEWRKKNWEKYITHKREHKEKNRLLYAEYEHRRTQKTKLKVLSYYSNGEPICAYCGEKRLDCLSIDHINGGGTRQRDQLKREGIQFYVWLKNNNFPLGFQVLCMNCQFIKRAEEVRATRAHLVVRSYCPKVRSLN